MSMFGLNINGDKETAELLSEILSSKRRKQGEIKRNLEIARQQSEIQHINAQTRSEIAAINIENANAELIRAQAIKTREETLKLRLENIKVIFELVNKEQIVFTSKQELKLFIKSLLKGE